MTKPTQREADDLLDAIGAALRERGVTLDELVEAGREERGAIFAEKYGLAAGYAPVPAVPDPKSDDGRAEQQAWGTITAMRAENVAHDPDALFADAAEAVADIRREPDATT